MARKKGRDFNDERRHTKRLLKEPYTTSIRTCRVGNALLQLVLSKDIQSIPSKAGPIIEVGTKETKIEKKTPTNVLTEN